MRRPFRRFVLLATTTAILPFVAFAQSGDSRYGSWSPPGTVAGVQDDKKRDGLLKELNALISAAERDRAANPVFLKDLKALTSRYANPWNQRLLFDDFSDGDFQRNPAWSVTSGEYWVEQGYGLRSRVTEAAAATNNNSAKISKEKLALSILGAVLQGANKNGGGKATTATKTASVKPSAIEARARISNAFSATFEISSWKAAGTFEVAMHQGLGGLGYRLAYTAGKNPRLELIRVNPRKRRVIDSSPVVALEDQKVHSIVWTRSADGAMNVSIDGKAILSARDKKYRDRFDALSLSSQGADVIVKSVNVMGMR